MSSPKQTNFVSRFFTWRKTSCVLVSVPVEENKLRPCFRPENAGRPLGDEAFLATLEQDLGRILRRQKPGPKGKPRS